MAAKEITIRADEWCPYNCVPGTPKPGVLIEIANIVFEEAGHKVKYDTMPWSRAIALTRQGKFDAIVGAYIDDAPDFVFPGIPLAHAIDAFYTLHGSTWTYQGIESLRTAEIGVIKDYSYGEKMDAYFKERKGKSVWYAAGDTPLKDLIRMMDAKRVDVLIANRWVIGNHFQRHGIQAKQYREAGVVSLENVYIAFSPVKQSSKIYADILTKGLKDLKKTGTLKRLLTSYGIPSLE